MKKQDPAQRIKSFEKKQFVVSYLSLLIFCGLSILLNTLHLQSVAEENTKFLSRMVTIGDFREASLILQEARLSNFIMIQYKSSQAGRSFTLPPKAEIFQKRNLWSALSTDSIAIPVVASLSSTVSDEIVFEFQKFRLIPYAILIWLALNLVSIPQTRFMKRRLVEQFHNDLEIEKKLVKNEITSQVRHNLRTPLAALMRIPKKLPDSVSKDRELLELTIRQIRELIAKLDDRPEDSLSDQYETDVYCTLLQSMKELRLYVSKSIQLQIEVDDILASTLVSHVPFELRAILGNLVTNSIEALNADGKIIIKAKDIGTNIEIRVSDTGRGISPESLSRVFDKNFSHGKTQGSGIGLSHAKAQIESWGGSISVESIQGFGTTLILRLPVKDRAPWYTPRLKLNSNSKIYVLDDQESGRELWRLKLDEASLLDHTVFASHQNEFALLEQEIQNNPEQFTLLFDYDLGGTETGLSLLQKMPLKSNRYLVTGHFENDEIREACSRLGIFLIPKSQIEEISIIG